MYTVYTYKCMILANPNHAQYLHSPSSQAMGSSSSYDHRQNATLLDLFNVFYRTGSLVYGGGQVRCTYVQRKNTEAVYTSVKFRGFLMNAQQAHTHSHTHAHTHAHKLHTRACMHTHTHTHTHTHYTYAQACRHNRNRIRTHTHAHTHIVPTSLCNLSHWMVEYGGDSSEMLPKETNTQHMCSHTYTHSHTHIHTCKNTHVYTHTHTKINVRIDLFLRTVALVYGSG